MFHVEQFFVDKNVLKKLETYEQILKAWQKKINIVSRGTLDDVWERHFYDSLQLIPIIDSVCYSKGTNYPKILDAGSGGGFPGMMLPVSMLIIKKLFFLKKSLDKLVRRFQF